MTIFRMRWFPLPIFLLLALGCAHRPVEPPVEPTGLTPLSPGSAVYHVTLGGDDGNDGTAQDPWRTIQHAVDTIGPGDTIWVHDGAYAGARIEQSGAEGLWMTLMAAPGATAVLDRAGPRNQHDSILELETWEGSGTVSYWLIEGLEVTGASGWGIDVRGSEGAHSHHVVLRGNRVHHNGWATESSGIFTAFVDDVVVASNESFENGEHGIYLSNSGDRPHVAGNRLHHNAFCGLHMNGDIDFGGDGTISNGLVEGNTIYENGAGGGCSAINMDGVTGSTVRNNLIYENHAGGISLFRASGAVCSHHNRILNNTIVQAAEARWALNITDFVGDGSGCTDNVLLNNIFYNQHQWRGAIELQRSDLPGFESDYNAVIGRFSTDEGESVVDLGAWQGLGYGEHSFLATPAQLFVDPAGGDYHLRPGSPAVDAGISLPDVPDDWEGQPRPAGAGMDVGADEQRVSAAVLFLPAVLGLR